jgi:hypothetical protein
MEHDTSEETGASCWCRPARLQACPECLDTHPNPACWRCDGSGWVSEFDPDAPVHVVHNDTDSILRELLG